MAISWFKNFGLGTSSSYAALLVAMTASAQTMAFSSGGLVYTVNGTEVEVVGCVADPCTNSVSIPATVTDSGTGTTYNVISVGSDAFRQKGITGLVIADGISIIKVSAFSENPSLTSLMIPASVTTIRIGAFFGTGLTSLTLPATVTSLGDGAFEGKGFPNATLASVNIEEGVKNIPASAFAYNKIATLTIPASVTTLVQSAFEANELTEVAFKGNRGSFSDRTFLRNPKLLTITYCEGTTGWPGDPFDIGPDGPGTLINVTATPVNCSVTPPVAAPVPLGPLWLLGVMASALSVLGIRKLRKG